MMTDPYASQDAYNGALERAYHHDLHVDSANNWRDVARAAARAGTIYFGGSALANLGGGAGAAGGVGDVAGGEGISADFLSTGLEGLDGLAPITTGAEFLPEVVGSGIPYLGAAEAAGMSTGALGSIPALAGAEAGGGALASIAPSGLPSGVGGFIEPSYQKRSTGGRLPFAANRKRIVQAAGNE